MPNGPVAVQHLDTEPDEGWNKFSDEVETRSERGGSLYVRRATALHRAPNQEALAREHSGSGSGSARDTQLMWIVDGPKPWTVNIGKRVSGRSPFSDYLIAGCENLWFSFGVRSSFSGDPRACVFWTAASCYTTVVTIVTVGSSCDCFED
ncbi:hypothetical protein RHGRI_029416 [Rhododendron griersonianum]|uniref:Uncharacterized protein n=1 Tax=Rhododendron griersonianum TaxID=479676 RepID=A0AAV6IJ89_9ERIC|nr:hypothetical protein RHGRI_029416 [Rhododendron griersonianum]